MAMANRFGRYSKERGQDVREAIVKSEPLQTFLKAFQELPVRHSVPLIEYYGIIKEKADSLGIRYDPQDVSQLCIALKQFEGAEGFDQKAAIYLSALIALGPAGEYYLPLSHFESLLYGIGYQNEEGRNVTIAARESRLVGEEMRGGSVIVEGGSSISLGANMNGGILRVDGSHYGSVGTRMGGGSIEIKGTLHLAATQYLRNNGASSPGWKGLNLNYDTGRDMSGGEIRLERVILDREIFSEYSARRYGKEAFDLTKVQHGKIYLGGELILDR